MAKFDFTPDPKVLIALTRTVMQPLDALCELIDNAIDGFYSANIQGIQIQSPIVKISLPKKAEIREKRGKLTILDNGPGMTAQQAERAIKAGYSSNNAYDTLGLFGMGFNISTGKLGNTTTLMTARADMESYIKVVIDLEEIIKRKSYELEVQEIKKGSNEPFDIGTGGTLIEISNWWPEGNPNHKFISTLINYGKPRITTELGRRYATILRKGKIRLYVDDRKCEAFEHCIWGENRFVVRKNGNIKAKMTLDQIVGSQKRCADCTAILDSDAYECPKCGSTHIRTVEERVTGWIGIQRYDSDTNYGIDLIRNGRAIVIGDKKALFEYVDEFKHVIKDYPVDSTYGRIVGEIHLDFVPVDFQKTDFIRISDEWMRAMSYVRGDTSLQPSKIPEGQENNSPMFTLFQGYRRVRNYGRADMYMGYWDEGKQKPERISREIEKEFLEKFNQRLPGYFDDAEWWKLVETADQKPVEKLPECPVCGFQHLMSAEVCDNCGKILKGKKCINPDCGIEIPQSAAVCPECGTDQNPKLLEPWTCNVCNTKNLSTAETCKTCGSRKGTLHPLSEEYLSQHSNKIDTLSLPNLSVKLPNGLYSNNLTVEVYATQSQLTAPNNNQSVPLVIFKTTTKLTMYIDLAHPYFNALGLSKEQLVANEIAQYIYQTNLDCINYKEFNAGNLAWDIIQDNWVDTFEINDKKILQYVDEVLTDIRNKLLENHGKNLAQYFSLMNRDQQKHLTNSIMNENFDLTSLQELQDSGKYILYAPFAFIGDLYKENPELFFDGNVWAKSLATNNLLIDADLVLQLRQQQIDQFGNYLQDVINYHGNRYKEKLILQRAKLSAEFLKKELAT